MILAMYSYLGYYNICYIGDEVRNPAKTIPRSILLSALLVCFLFVGLHLAMMGVVSWRQVPSTKEALDNYSLPAAFISQIYSGHRETALMSVLLIWSCIGSAFAGLLGYSRIPYGAARQGHFFAVLGRVHPTLRIPHVSLLLVGGLTLFWSFFDLASVITALITTRILEQFIGQILGVMLLRRSQPNRPRPYKIWLYPVPCGLALVGWLYLYVSAGWPFIALGLVTLAVGVAAFVVWSKQTGEWPFKGYRSNSK
jgi:amino acid transporter